MRLGWLIGAVLVVAGGTGAPADIYQWTYDQLGLGPGWVGHVFANRTGQEVVGLELLTMEAGSGEVLVVGGHLAPQRQDSGSALFSGWVAPGGVVIVALPERAALRGAAWVTPAGWVPIAIDLPIPRVELVELRLAVTVNGQETKDPGDPTSPEQLGPGWGWWDDSKLQQPTVEPTIHVEHNFELAFILTSSLDPELLQGWEGYPYLLCLDGRRSFSPLAAEIVAWQWAWEDGLVQEGPVVVRGFDRPGTYRFQLTVTDSAGRTQTWTRFATIADWEATLAGGEETSLGTKEPLDKGTQEPDLTKEPKEPEEPKEREPPPVMGENGKRI